MCFLGSVEEKGIVSYTGVGESATYEQIQKNMSCLA